jgi:hypothetical protein
MAQVEAKCVAIVQFCRTRITLLNADGSADEGAGNGYVSDQPVTLAINADIQAPTPAVPPCSASTWSSSPAPGSRRCSR